MLFVINVGSRFIAHFGDVISPSSPKAVPYLDGLLGGRNSLRLYARFIQDLHHAERSLAAA